MLATLCAAGALPWGGCLTRQIGQAKRQACRRALKGTASRGAPAAWFSRRHNDDKAHLFSSPESRRGGALVQAACAEAEAAEGRRERRGLTLPLLL